MTRALSLANRGVGRTSPNPSVGAVLVRDGAVVGEGRTAPAGGPHAEIVALAAAGPAAKGATAYVTLEPCAHHGRTPPCADALIAAGVARVVFALRDPNPRVDGAGAARLAAAGIDVVAGCRQREAQALYAPFARWITSGRPLVTAKWAMTLDGRIATHTGDSRWISGPAARAAAHRLRDRVDAILVGAGTILSDDPRLTVRWDGDDEARSDGAYRADHNGVAHGADRDVDPAADRDFDSAAGRAADPDGGLDAVAHAHDGRQPLRVVLDSHGRIPITARVFDVAAAPTLVATVAMPGRHADELRARGVDVVEVAEDRDGHVDVGALLDVLGRRGLLHVLVEGGAEVHGSFVEARAIDAVWAVVAPVIVGGAGAPGPVGGRGVAGMAEAMRLADVEVDAEGDDIVVRGRPIWAVASRDDNRVGALLAAPPVGIPTPLAETPEWAESPTSTGDPTPDTGAVAVGGAASSAPTPNFADPAPVEA